MSASVIFCGMIIKRDFEAEIGYICLTNPKTLVRRQVKLQIINISISRAPIIQCYYKGVQFVSKKLKKKQTAYFGTNG